MPTHHAARPHDRLLLLATALVALAALLRLISSDSEAETGPGPSHSTTAPAVTSPTTSHAPSRSASHRPTTSASPHSRAPHTPQQPSVILLPGRGTASGHGHPLTPHARVPNEVRRP